MTEQGSYSSFVFSFSEASTLNSLVAEPVYIPIGAIQAFFLRIFASIGYLALF